MDIGRILPGIAILSGQVAPHEDYDKDDNLERRYFGRILSVIDLSLRLMLPCIKLKYDTNMHGITKKNMMTVKRLTIFVAVSIGLN